MNIPDDYVAGWNTPLKVEEELEKAGVHIVHTPGHLHSEYHIPRLVSIIIENFGIMHGLDLVRELWAGEEHIAADTMYRLGGFKTFEEWLASKKEDT